MYKIFSKKQPEPVRLMIQFLRLLDVKVNLPVIAETLQKHPGYPSLLCFSDALTTWRVENVTARIAKENIEQLPIPFLAHLSMPVDALVLVTGIKNSHVHFLLDEKQVVQSESDFLKNWSGIALLAEKTDESGQIIHNTPIELNTLGRYMTIISSLSLIILAVISAFTFSDVAFPTLFRSYFVLALLQLSGIAINIMILWQSIDKSNQMLQTMCSSKEDISCNSVLESKYSRLFSWLTWSDIGLVYFTNGFIALMIAGLTQSTLLVSLVAWLSVASLPIVLLSVYFQWRVIKQWCLLCLSIQIILLLQISVSFLGGLFRLVQPSMQTIADSLILLALGGLTFSAVLTGKFLLTQAREAKQLQRELIGLKFNPQIWESLLHKQKKITITTQGLGINLGNPAATNTLVKICNPYCAPCAELHPGIDKLMEENGNLKMQIIFRSTSDAKDTKTPVVGHLLAIAEKGDENLIRKALDDWYLSDSKDYDLFRTLYPLNADLKSQDGKIEAMDEWCSTMEIKFTPTVFINGYQIPNMYTIQDLKYLLI